MRKRQSFYIKNNPKLVIVMSYIVLLCTGVGASCYLIYSQSKETIEQAAFRSHISWQSSGELFYDAILNINIKAGLISCGVGFVAIIFVHFYLERFFKELNGGVERLACKDFSCRLKPRLLGGFNDLSNNFNLSAEAMEKRASGVKDFVKEAVSLLDLDDEELIEKLKSINQELKKANFSE